MKKIIYLSFFIQCFIAVSATRSEVYMWVSTTKINGDIGGVSGADAICEADAPSSLVEKNHRAVIGTPNIHPRDFFPEGTLVRRPDGTTIFDSYTDFFDLKSSETNKVTTRGLYWTWSGFNSDGSSHQYHCENWTSASNNNVYGASRKISDGVIGNNMLSIITFPCSKKTRLLCVSY